VNQRWLKSALIGIICLAVSTNALWASSSGEMLDELRKTLAELKLNYVKNIKQAHRKFVGSYFRVRRSDYLFGIDFLAETLVRKSAEYLEVVRDMRAQYARVRDAELRFGDRVAAHRRAVFGSYVAEQLIESIYLIRKEMDEVVSALESACSEDSLRYPKALFNPKTLLVEEPVQVSPSGAAANFRFSMGFTMSTDGDPKGVHFFSGNNNEELITTVATAAGAQVGIWVAAGGVSAGAVGALSASQIAGAAMAGGLAAGAVVAAGFLTYTAICRIGEVEDYNAALNVANEINRFLYDNLPSREYSDPVIENLCKSDLLEDKEFWKKVSSSRGEIQRIFGSAQARHAKVEGWDMGKVLSDSLRYTNMTYLANFGDVFSDAAVDYLEWDRILREKSSLWTRGLMGDYNRWARTEDAIDRSIYGFEIEQRIREGQAIFPKRVFGDDLAWGRAVFTIRRKMK